MKKDKNTLPAIRRRAERLVSLFNDSSRKPIVIEFAGLPKAGKTTTIGSIQQFLKRCGFRVEVILERASLCPIRDKKHSNFNVWTSCTALVAILEKTQIPPRDGDPQILILDRGIFDSICWLRMMVQLARLSEQDLAKLEDFLLVDDWRKRITGVIVMTASSKEAMKREQGLLPVADSKGSIMNPEVLEKMVRTVRDTYVSLEGKFKIFEVNTSNSQFNTPKKSAEGVANIILSLIENELAENVFCVEKNKVNELYNNKATLKERDTKKLIQVFSKYGSFLPRKTVESNKDMLQAIPVVIIRNKSGDVLRLQRKEIDSENLLHKKIVIWAGGHAREEDSKNGNTMVECAIREIQEELRLIVEAKELKLIGSVYVDQAERTSKHVAIVYEWRAKTNDISAVLSTAEFYERRGNSLSGSFIDIKKLGEQVSKKEITEAWSIEIVEELLNFDSSGLNLRLPMF